MAKLLLGAPAKGMAKARFRTFNITLPAITPYSGPPLRGVAPQVFQAQNRGPAGNAERVGGGAGTAAAGRVTATGSGQAQTGAGRQTGAAQQSSDTATATPMPFPPALFRAASNASYDVEFQRGMHDMYSELFDGVLDAIEVGFNWWRVSASFEDVDINGPIATGGRLVASRGVDAQIRVAPSVVGWTGWHAMVRDAVAKGFEARWSALTRVLKVPGLPWYPAFTCFPATRAPPTPNVPTPFLALAPPIGMIGQTDLKMAMMAALHGSMDYAEPFFDAIGLALQAPLTLWTGQQMITGVLGEGFVPTFAPPYVPCGPVIGGKSVRSSGGHLSS